MKIRSTKGRRSLNVNAQLNMLNRRGGIYSPSVDANVCLGGEMYTDHNGQLVCTGEATAVHHGTGHSLHAIHAMELYRANQFYGGPQDSGLWDIENNDLPGNTGGQYPRYYY